MVYASDSNCGGFLLPRRSCPGRPPPVGLPPQASTAARRWLWALLVTALDRQQRRPASGCSGRGTTDPGEIAQARTRNGRPTACSDATGPSDARVARASAVHLQPRQPRRARRSARARAGRGRKTYVLFLKPDGFADGWEQTDLWQHGRGASRRHGASATTRASRRALRRGDVGPDAALRRARRAASSAAASPGRAATPARTPASVARRAADGAAVPAAPQNQRVRLSALRPAAIATDLI